MTLEVDFSDLKSAVTKMGPGGLVVDFEITQGADEFQLMAEGLNQGMILGQDIELKDINGSDLILNYKGHQVMLYIPDQGPNIQEVLEDGEKGRRVHVAECEVLDSMRNQGRFGRYDVISRMDGMFPVFGISSFNRQEIQGKEANLHVCMKCLQTLNYKRYDDVYPAEKRNIFKNFNFESFFETYSSYFKSLPPPNRSAPKSAGYSNNWPSISDRYRTKQNYCCEYCFVSLKSEKRLLHVHHLDGVRQNNKYENLRALCADCHKKQPHHGHMHVSLRDIQAINYLRRKQSKFDVFNYDKLSSFADTALEGLISKCRMNSLPTPDLGVAIRCGTKVVPVDLAWPHRNIAVLISTKDSADLESAGWKVFSAGTALTKFEQFQKRVR